MPLDSAERGREELAALRAENATLREALTDLLADDELPDNPWEVLNIMQARRAKARNLLTRAALDSTEKDRT